VRVLGINIQDSENRTRARIKDFVIRYPVARDADASVAHRYKVTATPTLILLDAQGGTYQGNRLPEDYYDHTINATISSVSESIRPNVSLLVTKRISMFRNHEAHWHSTARIETTVSLVFDDGDQLCCELARR